MNTRYKVIISNASLYTEFEISGSVSQTRIGTGTDCDCRMHKDLFFEPIGLTLTNSNNEWAVFCDDNLYIDAGDVRKLVTMRLEHGKVFNIKYRDSNNLVFTVEFLIDFVDGEQAYERKINIAEANSVRIGTNPQNDIVVRSQYLTQDDSIELLRRQNGYELRIYRTTHGVYRNGSKVESGVLIRNGDFFSMADISFYYKRGVLWTSVSPNIAVRNFQYIDKANLNNYPKFTRNTRVKSGMNEEKIDILDPPNKPEKPKANLLTRLLPSFGMLLGAGVMAMMGGSTMIIMSGISCSMAIITAIINLVQGKKEFKAATEKRLTLYGNYIDNKRKEIEDARREEFDVRNSMYTSLDNEVLMVNNFSSNLFDRVPQDDDFLHVRLGYGSVEAKRKINFKKQERLEIEDELQMKPEELYNQYKYLDNVPVICDFKKVNNLGIIGAPENRYSMMKNIVLDIVARQYYTDVKLFFVATEENRDKVELFRFLPYSEQGKIRTIISSNDSKTQIFEYLYKELSTREGSKIRTPEIVVFFYDEYNFQNHPLSKFNGKATDMGVTFVFLNDSREKVPQGCNYLIDVKSQTNAKLIDAADDRNNIDFTYTSVSDHDMKRIVSMLAPIYTEEISLEGTLTKNISMYEMLNILSADDIDLEQNWGKSEVYNSMAAPLGVSTGGTVYLDLHDKHHGPHGLVAGTTGSGKSEVLQTYILSMATLFHPYEVGFVIIDFKGGGMVNQFRDLPHLVGAITNIDGKEIDRSLKSIKAELMKRQRLFAEADVNHIDKYIKKFKKGEVTEPLPHLILIVDEFAELKAEQPEFMKELISAARIGRSLGVHLILATQKPSGQVDEQIWSNSRFRLCLKVQTQQDSNEVLKSPLAAEIKEPGRAYLQVGNGELFELFQSAYSGASSDTSNFGQMKEFDILSVSPSGKRQLVYRQRSPKRSSDSAMTQLDAIVQYVNSYCKKQNIAKLPDICLPSLPDLISYPVEKKLRADDYKVSLGLYDDPDNQYQGIATLDVANNNTMIIGMAQIGKTNMLQLIIRQLAETYSPSELNLYIADFGAMSLKNYENLAHVGGVVTAAEDEKFKNLFKLLVEEIQLRKKKLSDSGLSSFSAYKEAGYTDMPLIVLMMDNTSVYKELYSEKYDGTFIYLLREGVTYGVTTIITNPQTNGLSLRYTSNIGNRIAFTCNDRSEYSNIISRCRMEPKNVAGRALIEMDKSIFEFQSYICFEGEKEIDRVNAIRSFVDGINEKYPKQKAKSIPGIPEVVSVSYIKQNYPANSVADNLCIGLDYENIECVNLKLSEQFILGMAGKNTENKNQFVKTIMSDIRTNIFKRPASVYIVDNFEHSLEKYKNEPYVEEYSASVEALDDIIDRVKDELEERLDKIEEDGVEVLRKMPLLLVIINNRKAIDTYASDFKREERFKTLSKNYANLKVLFLVTDLADESTGTASIIKKIKDDKKLIYFGPAKELKLLYVGISADRSCGALASRDDAYLYSGESVMRIKTIQEV